MPDRLRYQSWIACNTPDRFAAGMDRKVLDCEHETQNVIDLFYDIEKRQYLEKD